MGEDMRIKVLVALVALLTGAPMADAVSDQSESLATPESFASIADPAARSAAMFVELGKVLTNPRCAAIRPAIVRARANRAASISRRWSAAPTVMGCRPCVARSVTNRPTSILPACRATRNGTSRRVRWGGKARHSPRSAPRSKIPSATVVALWRSWCITSAPTRWLAGLGRPALAAKSAPGTQQEAGALAEAWVKAGAVCPN